MDEGLSFEEALERLEKISQALEQGGLKLEEAIALYEEGIGLVRTCHERLNAAELKIGQLNVPAEEEAEGEDQSP
jgi:exodeoxyribonuclease VII small subunit